MSDRKGSMMLLTSRQDLERKEKKRIEKKSANDKQMNGTEGNEKRKKVVRMKSRIE